MKNEITAGPFATRVFAAKNVQQRKLLKALKRYVSPLAILVIALSTACAPIASTGHIATSRPSEATQSQFIVHFDRAVLDVKGDLTTTLESLTKGQHLAIEISNISIDGETAQMAITIDRDSFGSINDMSSEVLASVASELGIMAVSDYDGSLIASIGLASSSTGTSTNVGNTSSGSFASVGSSTTSEDDVVAVVSVISSGNSKVSETPATTTKSPTFDSEQSTTADKNASNEPAIPSGDESDQGASFDSGTDIALTTPAIDSSENPSGDAVDDESFSNDEVTGGDKSLDDSSAATVVTGTEVDEDNSPGKSEASNAGGNGKGSNGSTNESATDTAADDGTTTQDESVAVVFVSTTDDQASAPGNSGSSNAGGNGNAAAQIIVEPVIDDSPVVVETVEVVVVDTAPGNSGNSNAGGNGNAAAQIIVEPVIEVVPEVIVDLHQTVEEDSGMSSNDPAYGQSGKSNGKGKNK